MELTLRKNADINIISVSGKLDSNTSTEFESSIISMIDSGEKKILVDCSNMDYISSAGLRVLLLAAKKLKNSGGKIALIALKEHIMEVFEIAGFTSIFPIYKSNDEAIINL